MQALELEVRPDLRPRVHRLVLLSEWLTAAVVALAIVAGGLIAYSLLAPPRTVVQYPAPAITGPATIPHEVAAPIVRITPTWDWQSLVSQGRTPPMGQFTPTWDWQSLVSQGRTPPMAPYSVFRSTTTWSTPPMATPTVVPPTPTWAWETLVREGRTPPMGPYR